MKSEKKETQEAKVNKVLDIANALKEIRKNEKRKFEQSIDLIINLKSFDAKKESVNLFVTLPHKIKSAKIGAFLENKSNLVDTITQPEFVKYKDKKMTKKLVRDHDFFISNAKLMPVVATNFGRVLGPTGKMPSPQLGIIIDENEKTIKNTLDKFERVTRIKTKEPSIKLTIGKENMKDEDIEENIRAIYNAILNALPKNKENIKNMMIKFTMTKPIKIQI